MALSDDTGEYVDVLPLARGGMGTVSIAVKRRGDFSRYYAVKRLHKIMHADRDLVSSFVDEARIAGLIRNSHVVSVLDVGTDARGPYLVMDWIESMPLHRVIRQAMKSGHPIPMRVCLETVRQIAVGLHAAHELEDNTGKTLQVVHRDVSPQNVLVAYDGIVRVTDFGIARALDRQSETQTGQIKGKLGYLSPEQVRCQQLDRRSDLFSLGIVAFEMLTLERLYPGGPMAILGNEVPDLGEFREDAPDELVELLIDLLSKAPEHRPNTAQEIVERIEMIMGDLSHDDGYTIREYMKENFREDREHFRTQLAEALTQVKTPASKRTRTVWLGAAVALAALAGVAALAISDPEQPPALTLPTIVEVAPEAIVVEPAIEAVEDEPPAMVEAPEVAAVMERARMRVRMTGMMSNSAGSSMDMGDPGMGTALWDYEQ